MVNDLHGVSRNAAVLCNSATLNTPYKAGLTGAAHGTCYISSSDDALYQTLVYIATSSVEHIFLQRCTKGQWSDWVPIATAKPPQEYDLPMGSGATASGPCKYRKNQFGEVIVYGEISWANGIPDNSVGSATLPVGFRPAHAIEVPATFWFSGSVRIPGSLNIFSNGNLNFRYQVSASVASVEACAYFSASFVAAP